MSGRDERGRFVAGHQSRGGRPPGKRNLLAEEFYRDLFEVWELKGRGALEKLIEKDPGGFVKLVGSVMPREAATSILVGSQLNQFDHRTVEVSLVGIELE